MPMQPAQAKKEAHLLTDVARIIGGRDWNVERGWPLRDKNWSLAVFDSEQGRNEWIKSKLEDFGSERYTQMVFRWEREHTNTHEHTMARRIDALNELAHREGVPAGSNIVISEEREVGGKGNAGTVYTNRNLGKFAKVDMAVVRQYPEEFAKAMETLRELEKEPREKMYRGEFLARIAAALVTVPLTIEGAISTVQTAKATGKPNKGAVTRAGVGGSLTTANAVTAVPAVRRGMLGEPRLPVSAPSWNDVYADLYMQMSGDKLLATDRPFPGVGAQRTADRAERGV